MNEHTEIDSITENNLMLPEARGVERGWAKQLIRIKRYKFPVV